MIKKSYGFYNLPKRYGKKDYEKAIGAIIKKYSACKGLLSIYDWGKPSVHGISDIDILLVFDDSTASPLPFFMRSFNFLNSKARYLARHPFMFIDESGFKNIKYVYPNGNFELLHGKDIKINKLGSEEKNYHSMALLNDIIIRHYPRDFLEQFVSRRINARDTLLRLNSLKYSVQMIKEITKSRQRNSNGMRISQQGDSNEVGIKENNQWSQKLKLIHELRKDWFKNNDFDLLVTLTGDAINITMEIIESFRLFLVKNDLLKVNSGESLTYNGIKNKSIFVKNWDKEKALNEMSKMIKNKADFCSILPIELSAQLIEYSKYGGMISDYISKNISGNADYRIKYKDTIKKRIGILNRQAELAFKLRHSDFAAFFDFGYRNKSGVNNWVLKLVDRVRF